MATEAGPTSPAMRGRRRIMSQITVVWRVVGPLLLGQPVVGACRAEREEIGIDERSAGCQRVGVRDRFRTSARGDQAVEPGA